MSKAKENKLQQLIDRMVADSTKAHALAVELYGETAFLFEESSDLHVMSGDCDGPARERQKYIKLTAKGYYRVGGGAW
jgi:hypothetical protein